MANCGRHARTGTGQTRSGANAMKAHRVLLVLIAAGTAIFVWRFLTLRQLQSEQRQFEPPVEATSQTAPATPTVAPAPADPALSAAERSELLHLRGEAGSLRQKLTQATNELARLSRPTPAAASAPPRERSTDEEMQARQKMGRAHEGMSALLHYAANHEQHLPEN